MAKSFNKSFTMICTTLPGNISSSQECIRYSSVEVFIIKSNTPAHSRRVILLPKKKKPINDIKCKSGKSVAATEAVNVIISEWLHWPVRENMGFYQVVVLHVKTSDRKTGFKNPLQPLYISINTT